MKSSEETTHHKLIARETIYDHFLQIEKLKIEKKSEQEPFTRYVLKRPDATAILLYNKPDDTMVLVRQLRAPAFGKEPDPYLWELPAGVLEANENPADTIVRETQEETGLQITDPNFITACYASPGVFAEKIYLFYKELKDSEQVHEGGGLAEETEDIEICFVSRPEVFDMMDNGTIMDAKTLTALFWFRWKMASGKDADI